MFSCITLKPHSQRKDLHKQNNIQQLRLLSLLAPQKVISDGKGSETPFMALQKIGELLHWRICYSKISKFSVHFLLLQPIYQDLCSSTSQYIFKPKVIWRFFCWSCKIVWGLLVLNMKQIYEALLMCLVFHLHSWQLHNLNVKNKLVEEA